MMDRRKAMMGTILWGLLGAVGYFVCQTLFRRIHHPVDDLILGWWLLLAGYSRALAGWAQKPWLESLYPLALPVIALVAGGNPLLLIGLLIGVLSWIRSGLYFRQGFRGPWLEALLSGGGMVLVLVLTPTHHPFAYWAHTSPAHNALGLWLFFLVQSVYFLLMAAGPDTPDEAPPRDRFEDARRRAEEILSG